MRVAVVHNLPPGGARRRVEGHLRGLDAEVQELVLSTATPITENPIVVPVARRADPAPRLLKPLLRYPDVVQLLSAWRELSRLVDEWKPDVVYLNPCRYLQAPALSSVVEAPIVYFCDEPRRADYEQQAKARRNPVTRVPYWPLHQTERSADRRGVARAGQILTNSHYTRTVIRSAYGRDAEVVYCGVASMFVPSPEPLEPTHVLSVGTLIPTKGHDLAVGATAAAGLGLPLTVVAPRSDPAEEARLRALASASGLELTVRVGVSDAELLALYRSAFATVYLARAEPYGLVSVEAQASGCPVVVADEGGLPETVTDGGGVVVDRSVAAAAAALRRLGDPAVRAAAVAAARAGAGRHSWEASAAQVQGHLSRAVSDAVTRSAGPHDPRSSCASVTHHH